MADKITLQLRGNTTSNLSSVTGAHREVYVDTSNYSLVVNDGATAGGHTLVNETILTDSNRSFNRAQRSTSNSNASVSADLTLDFDRANNFDLIMTGNITLENPTGATEGQSGHIIVKQDSTGGRTMAYGNAWIFTGGTAPTLTTTLDAVDRLSYYVADYVDVTSGGNIHVGVGLDIK
tara:strand:+ start:837 stop:1370 length:534 start_codon:yes stop_codon:yes gene_type:complete